MNRMVINSIFLLPIALVSCTKKEGCTDRLALNYNAEALIEDGTCEYPKAENYHLVVLDPVADSIFGFNDTVKIKAEISSEDEIHGYSLELWNNTSQSLVFRTQHHVHLNPVSIDTLWVNQFSDSAQMKLILTAVVNHEGLQVSDTVNFSCR